MEASYVCTNADKTHGHRQKLFKRLRFDVRKIVLASELWIHGTSYYTKIVTAPSIKSFERHLDKILSQPKTLIKVDYKNSLKIFHRNKAQCEINNRTGREVMEMKIWP